MLKLVLLQLEVVLPLCKVWVLVVKIHLYLVLASYLLAYQLEFGQEFMFGPISDIQCDAIQQHTWVCH